MTDKKTDHIKTEGVAVPSPYHWGWAVLIFVMLLITWGIRYALPLRDGDIWWHMLYGKYFIENGTLIADHTIFSWSPTSNDRIYCTWLADIILYLLNRYTGLTGLFALRYFCQFILIVCCVQYARKLKIERNPIVWVFCLVALLMTQTGTLVKPEIFTTLFMYITVWLWWLIRSSDEKAWRYCYCFPLIMLLWVNSHGGFVFGLVFLALAGIGEFMNLWLVKKNAFTEKVRQHFLYSMILTGFSVFLTPYGYYYPLQLVEKILPSHGNMAFVHKIAAFTAPFSAYTPYHNFTLYANLALVFLVGLYAISIRTGIIDWSSLLSNLAFAFLYSRFFRTTFFWAPVFLFSSLYLVAGLQQISSWSQRFTKAMGRFVIISSVIIGGCLATDAVWKSLYYPEPFSWFGFGISEANPVSESLYIKKHFPESKIGNTYDQGGYLMWEIWPRNKVFFDSRHFPYRSWSDQFFRFMYGQDFDEFTSQYEADVWLIGHTYTSISRQFFQSDNWQLGYLGRNSAVYVRKGVELPTGQRIVSPDIFLTKNFWQSLRIFIYSTIINEWEIAEGVLRSNRQHFTSGKEKKDIEKMASFYDGIRSFHNADYQRAYNKILFAHPDVIEASLMLSKCLLFIAEKHWVDFHDDDATAAVRQSASMVENNVYIAYDLGVIGWYYREKLNEPDVDSTEGLRPPWYYNLTFFVKNVPAGAGNSEFITIAKAILAGTYNGRPPLIKPPLF